MGKNVKNIHRYRAIVRIDSVPVNAANNREADTGTEKIKYP